MTGVNSWQLFTLAECVRQEERQVAYNQSTTRMLHVKYEAV